MQLCKHRHNLRQDLREKSKLAQHAYGESHSVGFDKARISEIESKSRYRKYHKSALTPYLTNPTQFGSLPHTSK
jgi:hypothetical protein